MIWRMFTPRANTDPLDGRFDRLDRSGRMIAGLARRPLWPVLAMVVLTAGAAWWFVMGMAGSVAQFEGTAHPLGPGMSLISPYLPFEPGSFAATIADCACRAMPGSGSPVVPFFPPHWHSTSCGWRWPPP
jgi:hypothetical protein